MFEMTIETGANFPQVEGCYKMIQVECDGEKYFVFGFSTHANILKGYLQEKGVAFEYVQKLSIKMAAPSGERYRVVGMGRCDIIPSRKLALFSDQSLDYGIEVSQEYVDLLQALNPDWRVGIIGPTLPTRIPH